MDREINALLGKSSSHAEEAKGEWMETFEKKLNKQEYREKKMEEENEKKVFHVKCFQCVQCKVLTEQMVAVCREKGLHMCKYFGREFNTSLLSSLHLSISTPEIRRDMNRWQGFN